MAKEINSDLLRGNINTIILKALYNGDRYGYDIVRDIEIKSHGQYTIKQPTLYSCLKRLESQGFVTSYWGAQSNGGRRKYFSLTDMGREVFKQSQDDYEYSRTIIDKLISEDRYDLGDYTPSPDLNEESEAVLPDMQEQVAVSIENIAVEGNSTQRLLEEVTAVEVLPENAISATVEEEIVDNQPVIAESIVEEVVETTQEDKNDGFLEYISVSNDTSSDYVINDDRADEAAICDQAQIEEDVVTLNDNSSDITSMFNQESTSGSYIDNIESSEVESSSNGFATVFSSDFSAQEDADLFGSGARLSDIGSTAFAEEENSEEFSSYSGSTDSSKDLQEQFESLYDVLNEPEKEEKKDNFISYDKKNDPAFAPVEAEQEQNDEYQNKLGDIIENFYNPSSIELTREQISISALELNNKVQIKPFGSAIVDSARELGEEVHVRAHDNSIKGQYTTRYYYRSNLLRLFINAILFVVMLAESFIFWLIFKKGVGANGEHDVTIYVLSILLALALPIYAGIRFGLNPHAKKRIENEFGTSIVFKSVVMVLICVLCFLVHLYLGMPISGNISNYTVSLFFPMILSTNLPLSSFVFKLLYKSPYFMIKE